MALNVISAETGGKAMRLRARRMEDGKGRNTMKGTKKDKRGREKKGKKGLGIGRHCRLSTAPDVSMRRDGP